MPGHINRGFILCLFTLTLVLGCGGSGSDGGPASGGAGNFTTGGGNPKRVAIDNYVNNFIIPTLISLDNSVAVLEDRCRQFALNPTAENLASAKAAWVTARVPWENSEAALFGPVDFYGFDPALDTWPVNKTDLEAVLNSGIPLNRDTIANLDNALKGFHTIEYLLYGNQGEKQAGSITAREVDYLIATSQALKSITGSLRAAWIDGFDGEAPYAAEVVAAGQGSAAFPSETSAIEQFARGIATICDEVANGKIADPFDQRNPNIVESQFSGNSLADFANNISGAKDAYLTSLSELIKAADLNLDSQVTVAFDAAIGSIRAIPEPFLQAIQSPSNDNTIKRAQQDVRAVQNLIEGRVIPIILN